MANSSFYLNFFFFFFFLKKAFKNFHGSDSCKSNVKNRGLRQGWQKGANLVDLFSIEYFPCTVILQQFRGQKNQNSLFCLNYGGTCSVGDLISRSSFFNIPLCYACFNTPLKICLTIKIQEQEKVTELGFPEKLLFALIKGKSDQNRPKIRFS